MRNWVLRLWYWLAGEEERKELSEEERRAQDDWCRDHNRAGESPADYRPEGSEDGR